MRTRLIAGPTAGFVLSAVFATVMCVVSVGETLLEPLRVDPDRPAPVTLRVPPMTLLSADEEDGIRLETVALTVPRGSTVSDPVQASIVRMYEAGRRPSRPQVLVGLWFLCFIIASMMTSYLRTFSPGRGALLRTQGGILLLAAAFVLTSKGILLLVGVSAFVLPVACLGLWAALFLDRRTAFVLAVALSFLTAALVDFRLTAIAVYLVTGVTAVALYRDRKHSLGMIFAGVVAGVASAAMLVAARTIFEGDFDVGADIARTVDSEIVAAGVGGIAAGLIAFLLQGVAVLVLGAVSRQRLVDLSDLEQPLLKKMAEEAPGSWEHSRAMANLAEAAASAVGADALLTRVGAYYHDLGKTCQPKYYIENLQPGEPSPHTDLEPDVSADAIMAHVVEGVRILRRGGVPEPVVEFAYTHHGTSLIEFFWHKYQERSQEQGKSMARDQSFFRYPGMSPRTKETAILMLVDAIEAAARTIEPPTKANFEEMVRRIVFGKLGQGQLDRSGLTMEDLRVLSTRIAETLTSAYHKRIRYPWQDRPAGDEAEEPDAAPAASPAPAEEATHRLEE